MPIKSPPSSIWNVTNGKKELRLKSVRLTSYQKPTIVIRFNLLQVCPSVFAVLYKPSFHSRFEQLFLCFTQFGDSSHCSNFFYISWHSSFNIYFSYTALGGWLILETFSFQDENDYWRVQDLTNVFSFAYSQKIDTLKIYIVLLFFHQKDSTVIVSSKRG